MIISINKEGSWCVWEISGGDTKFPYTMKSMPLKDPGSTIH